jgi:4-hydroxy-tetrahydrodipicolinate synthase
MGAKGLLSGAGSVIASLQVDLFFSIKNKDLETAQKINEKIYPLVQAFYAPPFLDMHNRMKETLVLLGIMDKAVVRPPFMKLSEKEINSLRQAISLSGL